MDTNKFQKYIQTNMFDKNNNPLVKHDMVLIDSTNPKIGMVLSNNLIKNKILVGFTNKQQIYYEKDYIIRIDIITEKLNQLKDFFENRNSATKVKSKHLEFGFNYYSIFDDFDRCQKWLYNRNLYLEERDQIILNNIFQCKPIRQCRLYKINDIYYINKDLSETIELDKIYKVNNSIHIYSMTYKEKNSFDLKLQIIPYYYELVDKILMSIEKDGRSARYTWQK